MSGLESTTSGEIYARQSRNEGPSILPLEHFHVQPHIARVAFPNAAKPMNEWVAGPNPLSDRFRAYREDPSRTEEEKQIDITDDEALLKLFRAINEYSPETIH